MTSSVPQEHGPTAAHSPVNAIPNDVVQIILSIDGLQCWVRTGGGLDFLPYAAAMEELIRAGHPPDRAVAAIDVCIFHHHLTPLHSPDPQVPVSFQKDETFPLFLEQLRQRQHRQATPSLPSQPHVFKEPSPMAFVAYKMSKVMGMKQGDIVAKLSQVKHLTTQATVSRWIAAVTRFLSAGNSLPTDDELRLKIAILDPKDIEMGARVDHRTARQRKRASDEE